MKMKISWSMQTAKLGTTPKSKITPELVSASSIITELFESTIHNGTLVEFYVHELMSNYPEELPPSLYSWRILWTSTILIGNIQKFHPGSGIPRKRLFSVNHLETLTPGFIIQEASFLTVDERFTGTHHLLHGSNSCASISADIRSVSLFIQF